MPFPPPPPGAASPRGSRVPPHDGGGGSLHPDALRVLDADAGRLALTHDEAENVAIVADVLAAKHGGPFAWWVEYVLDDVRRGHRDRHGRRIYK